MSEDKKKEIFYFSTGCTLLDLVIGGGQGMGIPSGTFTNFIAPSSAGKSLVATETLAANFHKYGKQLKFNYDDTENGNTFDSEDLYNFELVDENTLTSKTVQQLDANLGNFLNKIKGKQIGIYVLDSLDGLTTAEKEVRAKEREKMALAGKEVVDDGTYGAEKPKFLSQELFPTRCAQIEDKNAAVIVVSQTRKPMNGTKYTPPTRAGGDALKFYCSTEVWFSTIETLKHEDRSYGVTIQAKTGKNRTPRPGRKCFITMYFDYGLDNIGSNIDFLFDLRTDKGALSAPKAKSINWKDGGSDESALDWSTSVVKEWMKDNELTEGYQKARKAFDGKTGIQLAFAKEWLESDPERLKLKDESFGNGVTREELIKQVSEDPKMEKELEERVIQKWESIEAEVSKQSGNRRKKYS